MQEQSNKRFGTRLKTESETGERRYEGVRLATFAPKTHTPRFTNFFADFEIKLTVLQSIFLVMQTGAFACESSLDWFKGLCFQTLVSVKIKVQTSLYRMCPTLED